MKISIIRFIVGLLTLICPGIWSGISACCPDGEHMRESRPVTGVYGLLIGREGIVSRYLAPVEYSGTFYGVYGIWSKAMPFAPHTAMMEFAGNLTGAMTLLNPRGNTSMQTIGAEFAWNMRRYWRLPYDLTLSAGGGVEADAAVRALLKNSNNPVSLDLAAALGIAGSAAWRHWFGRLPVEIGLNLRVPVAGAFFMPGYGETYYEIYLGNHSRLVHFGWPGNRQKLDLHLGVRLDFGRTAMEVGYDCRFLHSKANNLVDRSVGNAFTIGVIPGGLGMKRNCREIRP